MSPGEASEAKLYNMQNAVGISAPKPRVFKLLDIQ